MKFSVNTAKVCP